MFKLQRIAKLSGVALVFACLVLAISTTANESDLVAEIGEFPVYKNELQKHLALQAAGGQEEMPLEEACRSIVRDRIVAEELADNGKALASDARSAMYQSTRDNLKQTPKENQLLCEQLGLTEDELGEMVAESKLSLMRKGAHMDMVMQKYMADNPSLHPTAEELETVYETYMQQREALEFTIVDKKLPAEYDKMKNDAKRIRSSLALPEQVATE